MTLTFDLSDLETGPQVTVTRATFLSISETRVRDMNGTDGRTDGRTDRVQCVMRPSRRRVHHKVRYKWYWRSHCLQCSFYSPCSAWHRRPPFYGLFVNVHKQCT